MAYTGKKPVDFVDVTQSQSMTVSDDLTVDTNTLVVDSANNRVGINDATPSEELDINGDGSDVTIRMYDGAGASVGRIKHSGANLDISNTATSSATMTFTTGSGSGTQRMVIDSSGDLLIGCTTSPSSSVLGAAFMGDGGGSKELRISSPVTSTDNVCLFYNPNGNVGRIQTYGSATNYSTSSDYRLKQDWQAMTGATERVKSLNPVNFAWKVDGSRVDGFLAHEAAEVVPEAVTGEKDAMMDEEYEVTPAVLDEDGNVVTEAVMGTRQVPDYQGIDQSKLVPLLTAALQEAIAEIETLKTKVAALENA